MDVQLERLRGIISVFQMVEVRMGRKIYITPSMEELVEEIVKCIIAVGRRHEGEETDLNPETYLTMIYGGALQRTLKK